MGFKERRPFSSARHGLKAIGSGGASRFHIHIHQRGRELVPGAIPVGPYVRFDVERREQLRLSLDRHPELIYQHRAVAR